MSAVSKMILEAHRSAATLYASGDLTTAAVRRAVATVESLPSHVCVLSVDLRGIRRTDSRALRTLETFLRRWRSARRGMSRVQLPDHASTTVIAMKFTHKRWSPALAAAARPS